MELIREYGMLEVDEIDDESAEARWVT